MKSIPLTAGAIAVSLGLLTYLSPASALQLTTATETELFDLNLQVRNFNVIKGDTTVSSTVDPAATSSQTLTFDKFNSALGTLQGVTMVLTSDLGATVQLDASLGVDNSVTFLATGDLSLLLTGPGFISDLAPAIADVVASCLIDDNVLDQTCSKSMTSSTPTNANLVEAAPANFIGPGTFSLDAKLTGLLTPSTSPDNGAAFFDNTSMQGSLRSRWSGSVSLFYTYETPRTTVPEPITLYLLGAAVGAAALIRRRRRP